MRASAVFPPHYQNTTRTLQVQEDSSNGWVYSPHRAKVHYPSYNDRPYVRCREVLIMSSRRFVPCAAVVLGLFGLGGQIFHNESAATWTLVAGFYITAALIIVALRNRIAAWWRSSTLLPCGCAALLLFAGVNALARVDWQHTAPFYTNSSTTSPRTTPAPIDGV
jgi:hypothetical protein